MYSITYIFFSIYRSNIAWYITKNRQRNASNILHTGLSTNCWNIWQYQPRWQIWLLGSCERLDPIYLQSICRSSCFKVQMHLRNLHTHISMDRCFFPKSKDKVLSNFDLFHPWRFGYRRPMLVGSCALVLSTSGRYFDPQYIIPTASQEH